MPNLDSTFSLEILRIWNPDQLPPLRIPIGERALSASASVPHSAPMEQASLLPTWISGWSGKGSYARSLPSEGRLTPPLIYWNVERNNHFSLDVSIVDIFISSPGSKSHILAREEVKFFSSLCSRRSLWDSGLESFHQRHRITGIKTSNSFQLQGNGFPPFPRVYVCPSC